MHEIGRAGKVFIHIKVYTALNMFNL